MSGGPEKEIFERIVDAVQQGKKVFIGRNMVREARMLFTGKTHVLHVKYDDGSEQVLYLSRLQYYKVRILD